MNFLPRFRATPTRARPGPGPMRVGGRRLAAVAVSAALLARAGLAATQPVDDASGGASTIGTTKPVEPSPVTPSPARAMPDAALPTFDELEAAGARIGRVVVVTRNIFDTDDPREDGALYRLANRLHPTTKPQVIERVLPFRAGDPVRASVIEEAERVLRALGFLYDARIRPLAVADGVVDIEVETRDTWTLDPGIGASRSGGANAGSVSIREGNLLGTGTSVALGRYSNVDRSGTEFRIANEYAFGGRLAAEYGLLDNSDGRSQALRVASPFRNLDTRWAAGASVSRADRVESLYDAGEVVGEYRRRDDRAEVFGGWSTGRVDGWVTRWVAGIAAHEERYAFEPGVQPPPALSPDETLIGPFVRWQVIEDRFEKSANLDQIGRSEFLAFGLQSSVQIGYSARAFGASKDAWLYSATLGRAFEPVPRHTMTASGSIAGQLVDGGIERQRTGGRLQYYLPQTQRWLFYASVSGDLLTNPAPLDVLYLGGDNGLRGYPLRYQRGTQRALLTLEERLYTDLYLLRLFRIGGAAFLDVGRAWGGSEGTVAGDRWLTNVGFGIRIFNVRASFGNVLHVDVAFPLNGDPDISRVQLLVRARASF